MVSYDVGIVGGGPAGAAVALRLAGFELRVALFDLGARERQRVGESLPSSTGVVLRELGLELPPDVVVPRPPEHRVFWGAVAGSVAARGAASGEASMLVWRGALDRFLLERAEAAGVRVFRRTAVTRVERDEEGWTFEARSGRLLRARFAVDASGRAGVLSRARRDKEERFRTLALTRHFEALDPSAPTLVEAFPDGWIWSAPVSRGLRDVTVMLDLSERPSDVESLFTAALEAAPHVREIVAGAPSAGVIRGVDATPYVCGHLGDGGLTIVGDAASFLDPLAAHGVHKALDGAIVAAAVVRTILERPSRVDDAVRFYAEREHGIAGATRSRLGKLYLQETRFAERPFWRRRSFETEAIAPIRPRSPLEGSMALSEAPGVRIAEAPVLEGDYIERRPVLLAPFQERPVRFLGSVTLPDVFRCALAASDAATAARSLDMPYERAFTILDWLYRTGYLERRR